MVGKRLPDSQWIIDRYKNYLRANRKNLLLPALTFVSGTKKSGGWKSTSSSKSWNRKNRNLCLPPNDRNKFMDFVLMQDTEITCRLVKKQNLRMAKKKCFCTSQTGCERYSFSGFEQPYHYRWSEEDAYKLWEREIESKNFSRKITRVV